MVALSAAQIKAALERAVDLRCRTAIIPEEVRSHALSPTEAMQSTEGYRRNRNWNAPGHPAAVEQESWWRVGWVIQEPVASLEIPPSQTMFRRTWEVWLNVDDERVSLRPKRSH